MAMVVGITLVKTFAYRGDTTEEYSNQYWLTGGEPADFTAWKALADGLAASEKQCYPNDVTIQLAYGYNSDAPNAASVWSYDYGGAGEGIAGTGAFSGGSRTPGDCAVWIRWKTDRLNSKGKPVYLRKYFHPAYSTSGTGAGADTVLTAQKTALAAHGTKLMDFSLVGSRTLRAQSQADDIISSAVSQMVTTRSLKRRGKRPSS